MTTTSNRHLIRQMFNVVDCETAGRADQQLASGPRKRWRYSRAAALTFVVACMVIGLAIRLAAARGDLWLDEIWSQQLAVAVQSPVDVILKIRHDNNHYLNTLWLAALGDGWGPLFYRLPAIIAGVAMIPAGLWLARSWSMPSGVWMATLVASSYVLVHYSSEARGYAGMMLAAMLATAFMQQVAGNPSLMSAAGFAAACCFGFLSHLTFLFFFVAAVGYFLVARPRLDWGATFVAAGVAIPTLLFAAVYLLNVRGMTLGGGNPTPVSSVVITLLSKVMGGPENGPAALVAALGVATLATYGAWLAIAKSRPWQVFSASLVVAPTAVLMASPPPYLYPRYFLIWVPFLLLAMAVGIAALWDRRGWARLLVVLFFTVYLAGNSFRIAELARHGRGRYEQAVAMIEKLTEDQAVTIMSDHDFRNGMVLSAIVPRGGIQKEWRYYQSGQWPTEGAEWFLRHRFEEQYRPAPLQVLLKRLTYRLVKHFPYAGLSGWHWDVYRREPGTPPKEANVKGLPAPENED